MTLPALEVPEKSGAVRSYFCIGVDATEVFRLGCPYTRTVPVRSDRGDMEAVMAKGQKRSNREVRKPKADKPAAAAVSSTLLSKAAQSPTGGQKKK